MELFCIRHAIAEPRTLGQPDSTRALTEEGRARFSAQVRGMDQLKWRFDRVYHSPWLRAVQTAELLLPCLEGSSEVTSLLARDPGEELLAHLAGERVAVVGHEPWMSELTALLLTGDPYVGGTFIFKKGGVAWLEGDPRPGGMVLRGFVPPRILRTLG